MNCLLNYKWMRKEKSRTFWMKNTFELKADLAFNWNVGKMCENVKNWNSTYRVVMNNCRESFGNQPCVLLLKMSKALSNIKTYLQKINKFFESDQYWRKFIQLFFEIKNSSVFGKFVYPQIVFINSWGHHSSFRKFNRLHGLFFIIQS